MLDIHLGFPGSSNGKESACNMGDLGLISGWGGSLGGGHGNPLQCSCLASRLGEWPVISHFPGSVLQLHS